MFPSRAASLVLVLCGLLETAGALKTQRPPQLHVVSHRSCSNDPKKKCNRKLFEELVQMSDWISQNPMLQQHHFFQALPKPIYDNPKWNEHIHSETGRGYWFWKPALINHLLHTNEIIDGDTVVWIDADVGRDYVLGKGIPERYAQIMQHTEWDVFVKNQPFCELQYDKQDIFTKFGVNWDDRAYGPTAQAHAQFAIFKINAKSRQFLQYWEDIMADFQTVSNDPSTHLPEHPGFLGNRNDQSVLSMLAKSNLAVERGEQAENTYKKCCSDHGIPCGSLDEVKPDFNKIWGIPGLVAKIGDLYGEPQIPVNDVMTLAASQHQASSRRTVCVWDKCIDLNNRPKDGPFLAQGVEDTFELPNFAADGDFA